MLHCPRPLEPGVIARNAQGIYLDGQTEVRYISPLSIRVDEVLLHRMGNMELQFHPAQEDLLGNT